MDGHHGRQVARRRTDDLRQQIVVHPTKPDHVLCGGVDLHLTTNGGKSWQRDPLGRQNRQAGLRTRRSSLPADVVGAVRSRVRFERCGLDISDDGGKNWTNCSKGLAVTMYYDLT
ncbi:MAG: hypothetical protein U0Y68_08810 [Blastocatellia bacterium]